MCAGLLLVSGCATTQTGGRTELITVPHVVQVECPTPREVTRPSLAIDQLSVDDAKDAGKIVQAYKATVLQLQGYALELETIIDGYRSQQPETGK